MTNAAGRTVSVLLAAVLLATGCASSARRGGLIGTPSDSLETAIGKIRELSARARPVPKHTPGVTVESLDPQLQGALLAVRAWPSAATHRLAAQEYVRVRVLDAAFDHYSAALRIDSRDAASYDGLARIWRDWRLPALALGDARRAVYHAAGSAEAYNTLGTVLQALGLRAEAKKAYRRSLELKPGAAYALNNLGYVALLDGDVAAVGHFQRAIAADGNLVAARHNLALAYAAAGRLDLARRELQQSDAPAAADYNFGIINLSQRNEPAALAAFEASCDARAGIKWACERFAQLRDRAPETEGTP